MESLLVGLAACVAVAGAPARAAAERGDAEHRYRRPVAGWVNALKPKGRSARSITLARDGKTETRILIPAAPTTMEEKAAADLARWLEAMTGTDFPVANEEPGTSSEPVISVGNTALRAAAGLADEELGFDGYAIAAKGEALFITGGTRRGIINGVYALLEEDLGCRWYQSGDAGLVIPHQPTLRFRPVPRRVVPSFEMLRGVHYSDARDTDWNLRNRTFHWWGVPSEWGGWAKWVPGFCHTYNAYVPSAEHFEKHPTYFMMMDDGRRAPLQLCPTNPDVAAIVLSKARESLRKSQDAVYLDVSPNDGGGACHCPDCKALIDREGTEMAPLLQLVNTVADGIREEHPRVFVTTLAYLNTVAPPKTFGPRANVLIWLCTDAHAWGHRDNFIHETDKTSQAMQAWHDTWGASSIVWDYPSGWGLAPVNFNLPVIAENLRWYAARGARGILFQTEHNHNYGIAQSYQRCWIFAKLGWDPTLDTRALIRDFNHGFYGAAAPQMQAYDDMLWSAWEAWHRENAGRKGTKEWEGMMSVQPTFWEAAEQHLAAAGQAVEDDPVLKQRVRTARLPLQYAKLEKGPGKDAAGYTAMIDEFEADARQANCRIIEGVVGPPIAEDLSKKVDYWRQLAAPPPAIPYSELGNAWRFAPDPENRGMTERWFDPAHSDLAWATVRSDTGGGWDSQGFSGIHLGWYRQTFSVTDEMLRRPALWMLFGAVDEEAEVFINGELAFEHTVKSTGQPVTVLWNKAFVLDARPFVRAGKNTLAVRVTDTIGMAGIWLPVRFIPGEAKPDPQPTLDEIQLHLKIMKTLNAQ